MTSDMLMLNEPIMCETMTKLLFLFQIGIFVFEALEYRGAGFVTALVLVHQEQYHRPKDNTKLLYKPLLHIISE